MVGCGGMSRRTSSTKSLIKAICTYYEIMLLGLQIKTAKQLNSKTATPPGRLWFQIPHKKLNNKEEHLKRCSL